jgi:hypothetical protein
MPIVAMTAVATAVIVIVAIFIGALLLVRATSSLPAGHAANWRGLAGHHLPSSVAFASVHWTVRGPVHATLSGIPMLVEARLAETVGGSFRQCEGELASRLDAQLVKTLRKWYLTVRVLMNSLAPISGLDRPSRAISSVPSNPQANRHPGRIGRIRAHPRRKTADVNAEREPAIIDPAHRAEVSKDHQAAPATATW